MQLVFLITHQQPPKEETILNKTMYAVALATVMIPTIALADGNNNTGGDSCRGNCPQGGDPVSQEQGQAQGQIQGQIQGQELNNANTNQNVNSNEANAGAIAGSSSDSSATGVGIGGSSVTRVAVKTGPTVSGSVSNAQGGKGGDGGDSVAYGGTSIASGGDSRSYSEGSDARSSVGDVTSSSGPSSASASNGGNKTGDVGISIRGDSVTYEDSASRAASVYAQVCQSGGSAQAKAGGLSVVNAEPLCEHLKMAAVMREAYQYELKYGSVSCVESMKGPKMDNGTVYTDVCFNEKAKKYYDSYHEHMADAMLLMDKTEEAGLIDKFSGYMVRPMALIGALIWLI